MREFLKLRWYGNSLDDARIVGFYMGIATDDFHDWVVEARTNLPGYVSIDIDRFKDDSIVLFSKINKSEFGRLRKMLSSLPKSLQSYHQQMANLIPALEIDWLAEEGARNEKAAAYRAKCAAKRAELGKKK